MDKIFDFLGLIIFVVININFIIVITRTTFYRISWLVVVIISFTYAFHLIVNAFNDWALSPAVILLLIIILCFKIITTNS